MRGAYADGLETILRARRFALSNIQLLSASGFPLNKIGQRLILAGARAGAARVRVSLSRICGDAEPRPFADQRTYRMHRVDGFADAQAASCPEDATRNKEWAGRRGGTWVRRA